MTRRDGSADRRTRGAGAVAHAGPGPGVDAAADDLCGRPRVPDVHLLSLAATAVLATVTWALTVILAHGMSYRNYRGPAELLLRRLTYARSP
jgi:hypothetical protein